MNQFWEYHLKSKRLLRTLIILMDYLFPKLLTIVNFYNCLFQFIVSNIIKCKRFLGLIAEFFIVIQEY